MARLARMVVPGVPHHVTQRGNYRQRVFFDDADYAAYRDLIAASAHRAGVEVWSWCLMPNHVHFIMTPRCEDGLRAVFAEAHRSYAARIHARFKVTGHLWQGRFSSTAMDERHLLAAARYVPMNPVRAGLTARAADWRWSSALAQLSGVSDGLTRVEPLAERIPDFAAFLEAAQEDEAAVREIRNARTTGRPVGNDEWLRTLEAQSGRILAPRRRGPRPRPEVAEGPVDLFHTVSP